MIQNNVVMLGLTILMHFQQLEEHKFQNFSWGAYPRPSKSLVSSALAWPVITKLITWSWVFRYAPPTKNPSYGPEEEQNIYLEHKRASYVRKINNN